LKRIKHVTTLSPVLLMTAGQAYYHSMNYEKALNCYNKALLVTKVLYSDRIDTSPILRSIAETLYADGQYKESIKYWENYRASVFQQWGRKPVTYHIAALRGIGNCFQSLCRFSEAIKWFEQCLEILREKPNEISEFVSILATMSEVYQLMGDKDKGIECRRRIMIHLENAKTLQISDFKILQALGQKQLEMKSYDEALIIFTSCGVLLKRFRWSQMNSENDTNIGKCYLGKRDYERALSWFKLAQFISYRYGAPEVGLVLGDMGICSEQLKKFNEARDFYLDAIKKLQEETKCSDHIAELLARLGQVSLQTDAKVTAKQYYQKSIEMFKNTNNIDRMNQTIELLNHLDTIGAFQLSRQQQERLDFVMNTKFS